MQPEQIEPQLTAETCGARLEAILGVQRGTRAGVRKAPTFSRPSRSPHSLDTFDFPDEAGLPKILHRTRHRFAWMIGQTSDSAIVKWLPAGVRAEPHAQ